MARTRTTETAADRHARLLSKGGLLEPPPPADKVDRPVIQLEDGPIAEAVDTYCACDVVEKGVDGHKKAARKTLAPELARRLCLAWAQARRRLDNPQVTTPRGSSPRLDSACDEFVAPRNASEAGPPGLDVPFALAGEFPASPSRSAAAARHASSVTLVRIAVSLPACQAHRHCHRKPVSTWPAG